MMTLIMLMMAIAVQEWCIRVCVVVAVAAAVTA